MRQEETEASQWQTPQQFVASFVLTSSDTPRRTWRRNRPVNLPRKTAVRLSLRESLVKTSELIHALKRQRRRSRLVASTLASLRELDAVAQ